jgi:hypothetical protein
MNIIIAVVVVVRGSQAMANSATVVLVGTHADNALCNAAHQVLALPISCIVIINLLLRWSLSILCAFIAMSSGANVGGDQSALRGIERARVSQRLVHDHVWHSGTARAGTSCLPFSKYVHMFEH